MSSRSHLVSAVALHPSQGPWAPAAVALRLARQPQCWAPLVEHRSGERCFAPVSLDGLSSTEPGQIEPSPRQHGSLEAWVVSWAPGTELPLHDHGGAAGALALVEGRLVEHHGRRPAGARGPVPLRTRLLDAVTVVAFDEDHVHHVANPGVVPAVSLHVYTPASVPMAFLADEVEPALVGEVRSAS